MTFFNRVCTYVVGGMCLIASSVYAVDPPSSFVVDVHTDPKKLYLSWEYPAGATKVAIRVKEGTTPPRYNDSGTLLEHGLQSFSSPTILYQDFGLDLNKTYTYSAFALDDANNLSATVSSVVYVGANPKGFSAVPKTGLNVVDLTWDTPTSNGLALQSVVVVRKLGSYPTYATDGFWTSLAPNQVSYVETDVEDGSWYYAVFNRVSSGVYSPRLKATSVVTVDGPPDPVVSLVADVDDLSSTKLNFSWENPSNSDFSSVMIRRADGTTAPSTTSEGTLLADNVTGVSASDSSVSSGTTYAYSFFAKDSAGYFSSLTSVVVRVGANPSNFVAAVSTSTPNQINLSWTLPSGTFKNVILVRRLYDFPKSPTDGTPIVLAGNATSYKDTGRADGNYYYAMFIETSTGVYGPRLRAKVGGEYTYVTVNAPPDPVENFTATLSGTKSVVLSWISPNNSDFSNVVIRRSTSGYPSSISDGDSIYTGALTTFTDSDLSDGTYYYSIFTKDTSGQVSVKATANKVIENNAPNALPNFSASGGLGTHEVTLSWSWSSLVPKSNDFQSVTILRKLGTNAPTWAEKGTTGVTTVLENSTLTSYAETLADATYSYSVFAKDTSGKVSDSTSSTITVNGPPDTPSTVSAYFTSGKTVVLKWANPTDTSTMKILRRTDRYATYAEMNASGTTLLTPSSLTTFTDDVPDYGTYYYTIFAGDASSYYSEPAKLVMTSLPDPSLVKTVGSFSDAVKGCVDAAGNVYITTGTGKTFRKYNAKGELVFSKGGAGSGDGLFSYAGAIAVNDTTGEIYVVDRDNYRVQRFNAAGTFLGKFGSAGTVAGKFSGYPIGIRLDQDGKVYVTDKGGYFTKFNSDGSNPIRIGGSGAFSDLEGVWVTQNVVYLADGGRNQVVKYSTSGTLLGSFGSIDQDGAGKGVLSHPMDLFTDTLGNVYVLEQGNKVQMYSPSGNFLKKFDGPSGGASSPVGMFSDRAGRFFIINNAAKQYAFVGAPTLQDTVSRYSNQSTLDTTFVNPVSNFGSLTIRRSATGYPLYPTSGDLDSEGITGTTRTLTLSSLSEGLYYYSAFAKAKAPNTGYSLPVTFNVWVDRTAPASPTGFSNPKIVSINRVALSWVNPSDAGSGFSSVTILRKPGNLSETTWGTDTPTTILLDEKTLLSKEDTNLADGVYTYAIFAKDRAGNSSVKSYKVVTVDVTAPTLSGGLGLTYTTGTRLVSLSWTGLTDGAGVGLKSITILRRSDHTPSWGEAGTTVVTSNLDIANALGVLDLSSGHENNLSDGHYYYAIFAQDAINNFGLVGASDVVVNGKPGSVSGFSASHAPGSRTVSLKWSLPSDADLSAFIITRKTGGYASSSNDSSATIFTITNTTLTSTQDTGVNADETYYYSVYSKDSGGNISEVPAKYSLLVDSTPPPSITGLGFSRNVGSKVVTLNWTNPSDPSPGSGLSKIQIVRRKNGVNEAPVTFNVLNMMNGAAVSTRDTRITQDGIYVYSLYAIDARGNTSNVTQGTMEVDTTLPSAPTSFTATTVKGSGSRTVTLGWSGHSEIASVAINRSLGTVPPAKPSDGTVLVSGQTSVGFSDTSLTADHDYAYTIFAQDSFGNISSSSAVVHVDTLPPSAPGSFNAVSTLGSRTVALSWTNPASDFGSVTVVRKPGNNAPSSVSDGTLVYTGSGTSASDLNLADGTYSYSVFAKDNDENISGPSSKTSVSVNGPPSSTTGFSVTNTPGSALVQFAWTHPTDSDFASITVKRRLGSIAPTFNAPDAVVVTADLSGKTSGHITLSDETYSFSIFAKDSAGNLSASQAFTGMKVDTTAPAQPTNVRARRDVGSRVVVLSWDALASDVTTMTLVRNDGTTTKIDSNAVTTTSDRSITQDGQYYYNLYVQDSYGNMSNPVRIDVEVNTTPPGLPGSFSAVRGTGREVQLTWDALDSDVATVILLRKKDADPTGLNDSGAVRFNLSGSSITTTTDTRIVEGGVYFYRLYTEDSFGNISVASTGNSVSIDTTPPESPSGLSATYSLGSRVMKLDWINPSNENYTNITILRVDGTTPATYANRNAGGVTIVTENLNVTNHNPPISEGHERLSADGIYTYSIFALDAQNNVSALVGKTSTATVFLDTATPNIVQNVRLNGSFGSRAVTLRWTNPTDTNFGSTVILRRTGSAALARTDSGVVVVTQNKGISAGTYSFTDTLIADETYYYTFLSYDSVGNQSNAVTRSFLVDVMAPNAPVNVKGYSAPASRNVRLTWVNPSDISPGSGFRSVSIRRSDSGYPTSISSGDEVTTNYVSGVSGAMATFNHVVNADKTYYFSLFAKDATGNVSARSTVKVVVDSVPPGKPTGVSATTSGSKVTLSWSNGLDVSPGSGFSYAMVRRATGNVAPARLSSGNFVASSSALQTLVDANLPDGTYAYTIFGVDAVGNVSTASVGITVDGPTDPPSNVMAVPTQRSVALSWGNPTAIDFASITIRRLGGTRAPSTLTSGQAVGSVITNHAVTSFTDSGLSDGVYSYTLFSKDTGGHISSSSVMVRVNAVPATPNFVSVSQVKAGSRTVSLQWTNPSDADFASLVLVRTLNDFATSPSDRTHSAVSFNIASSYASPKTSTQDTRLLSDDTYYYSLFALDTSGNISAASQKRVTVNATAPGVTTFSSASVAAKTITLAWVGPVDDDMNAVRLVRQTTGYPATPTDGVVVATVSDTTVGATNGTYADTVTAEGVYYYSAFSMDRVGNYASPGLTRVTVDVTAPGPATGFSASHTGSKGVSFTWTNPTDTLAGVASVTIRRGTTTYPSTSGSGVAVVVDQSATNGSGGSFSETLSVDGIYYYSLFVKDKNGNESVKATTTVTVDTERPASPSHFQAISSGKTVTLNWVAPADFDLASYVVRRLSGYNPPASISDGTAVSTNITALIFSDKPLSDGVYSYSIFAKDLSGKISDPATLNIVVNDAPERPTGFTASTMGTKTVTLSWTNPSNTDFTSVTILRNGVMVTQNFRGIFNAAQTTTNVVTYDGTYTYSVYAVDASGNRSVLPATASVVVETEAPSPATGLRATRGLGKTVQLSWVNPLDLDLASYSIRYGIGSAPKYVTAGVGVADSVVGTSTSHTPTLDGRYFYSVFARDTSGKISLPVTTSVRIETVAPSPPTSFTAASLGKAVTLSWVNSVDLDFASVTIRRNTGTYPTSPLIGDVVVTDFVSGNASSRVSTVNVVSSDGVYYYSIFAKDASGNVSTKATVAVNVDSTPPSPPTNFSLVASGKTVYLSWTRPTASDLNSVKIVRRLGHFPSSLTDGFLVVTALESSNKVDTVTSDATYYYSAFAVDTVGNLSSPATKSILIDTSAPGAPRTPNAAQVALDSKKVRLVWTNPTDLDFSSVVVRRSTSGYPTTYDAGALVTENARGGSVTDNVNSDGFYYYSFFASDLAGNKSVKATTSIRVESGPPSTPNTFTLSSQQKRVGIYWRNPGDLDFSSIAILRSTQHFITDISDPDATVVSTSVKATNYFDDVPEDYLYYYTLFAKDVSGNVSQGVTQSILVDSVAPPAPTDVKATHNFGSRAIKLTWVNPVDAGAGLESLMVLRKTGSYSADSDDGTVVSDNITGTTLNTTVPSDGTYYFSVFAKDVRGNIGDAGQIRVTIDVTAPGIPMLNLSSNAGSRTVNVMWTTPVDPSPGTGFASVSIRRKAGSYPTSITDGVGVATDNTSLKVSDNVGVDGTYYYSIFAKDVVGNISSAGTASILVDSVAPPAPGSFGVTRNKRIVTLSWVNPTDVAPGSGFASVSVRRSTEAYPATIASGSAVLSASTATTITETLSEDNRYYYSIFARDVKGNVSRAATLNVIVDITPPPAPASFVAVPNGSDVVLTWTNPNDVVPGVGFGSVTVRRSLVAFPTSPTRDVAVTVNTITQTVTDKNLGDGVYYYSIFAQDLYGNTSVRATVNAHVETGPPHQPTSFLGSASGASIALSWVNPTDLDFHSILLLRSTNAFPTTINAGRVITRDVAINAFSDVPTSDGTYYYSLFARDSSANYTLLPVTRSVVLDSRYPGQPTSVQITNVSGKPTVNISWVNPTDLDFASVFIKRQVNGYVSTSSAGYLVTQNVTRLSFLDTPTSDGTYYYSIYAKDSFGKISQKAGTGSVTIQTNPPGQVSNLVLLTANPHIILSWQNPTDQDYHSVMIRRSYVKAPQTVTQGVLVSENVLGTLFSDTPTSDGRYYYAVFTRDNLGSVNPLPVTKSIVLDAGAPAAPTSFSAVAVGSDVNLTWVNPTDLDFKTVSIRRRTDRFPNGIDDVYVVADNLTGTSFSNFDLSDGRYYYSLFAKDQTGHVSVAARVTVDVDTAPPLPVTQVVATTSGNKIVVSWKKSTSTDFDSVAIVRNFGSFANSISQGTLVTTNSRSTSNAFAIPGDGLYYFSVFAKDQAGNYASPATANLLIDTTPPSNVTNLVVSSVNTKVYLTWTNPTDLDLAYLVVRRSLTGYPVTRTDGVQVGSLSKIQSVSETPTRDGLYYYSVFAVDGAGNVGQKVTGNVLFNIFAPQKPSGTTVHISGSTVSVNWTTYTDFDYSHVKVVRVNDLGAVVSFNVVPNGFKQVSVADGTYQYRLYAVDTLGHTSEGVSLSVVVDTVQPSYPTQFVATSNGRTVTLTWVNPSDLDFQSVSITRTTDPNDEDDLDRETIVTGYTGTSTILDEHLSDGTYYYTLIAYDRTHNASNPVTVSVLVDANPPNKPTQVSAERFDNTVALKWTNPTYDFASILIRRTTSGFVANEGEGDLITQNTVATSYSDTIAPGATYYYSIFAKDVMRNYSEAAYVSVNYPADDLTPPNPPKPFGATLSDASVRLSWGTPTANDFHSVRICRSSTVYPSFNVGLVTQNITANTYWDLNLSNGTYYYSIFARDISGNYSRAATLNVTVFVRDVTAPQAPTEFKATSSGKSLVLTWVNPTDLDFTTTSLRTSSSRYPLTILSDVLVTENMKIQTLKLTNLAEGKHYFSLFARDQSGNISKAATVSVVVDSIAPGPVTKVTKSVIYNSLSVSWTNPTGSDFYKVRVVRSQSGYPLTVTAGILVMEAGVTRNYVSELGLPDGQYYYSIFTLDVQGNASKAVTFNFVSDTAPPRAVSGFGVSASRNYTAILTWSKPTDDAVDVTIRRSMSTYPNSLDSGSLVSSNVKLTRLVLSNLQAGTHYFSIFSRDANSNYGPVATSLVVITVTPEEFQDGIQVDGADIKVETNSTTTIQNPVIGSSYLANVTLNATLLTNGLVLGANTGSSGTVHLNLDTSEIREAGSLVIGRSGFGKVVQTKGFVQVLGTLTLGQQTGSSGNYVLSGGGLYAKVLRIGNSGKGNIKWTGGTLQTTTIVGALQNEGGILLVDSSSPLSISGSYAQDENSKIQITLNSVNRALSRGKTDFGSASSLITVEGAVALNGEIEIVFDGYSPRIGDTIRLINKAVVLQGKMALNTDVQTRLMEGGGSAVLLSLPTLSSGQKWDTSDFETDGVIRVLGSSGSLVETKPLNYPNPFKLSTGTRIGYFLNDNADIELRVYLKTGVELYREYYSAGQEGGKVGQNYIPISASVVAQDWPAGAYFYVLLNNGTVVAKGRFGVLPE